MMLSKSCVSLAAAAVSPALSVTSVAALQLRAKVTTPQSLTLLKRKIAAEKRGSKPNALMVSQSSPTLPSNGPLPPCKKTSSPTAAACNGADGKPSESRPASCASKSADDGSLLAAALAQGPEIYRKSRTAAAKYIRHSWPKEAQQKQANRSDLLSTVANSFEHLCDKANDLRVGPSAGTRADEIKLTQDLVERINQNVRTLALAMQQQPSRIENETQVDAAAGGREHNKKFCSPAGGAMAAVRELSRCKSRVNLHDDSATMPVTHDSTPKANRNLPVTIPEDGSLQQQIDAPRPDTPHPTARRNSTNDSRPPTRRPLLSRSPSSTDLLAGCRAANGTAAVLLATPARTSSKQKNKTKKSKGKRAQKKRDNKENESIIDFDSVQNPFKRIVCNPSTPANAPMTGSGFQQRGPASAPCGTGALEDTLRMTRRNSTSPTAVVPDRRHPTSARAPLRAIDLVQNRVHQTALSTPSNHAVASGGDAWTASSNKSLLATRLKPLDVMPLARLESDVAPSARLESEPKRLLNFESPALSQTKIGGGPRCSINEPVRFLSFV